MARNNVEKVFKHKVKICKLCGAEFEQVTSEKYCFECIKKHGTGIKCSRAKYMVDNRETVNLNTKIRNSWGKFGCNTDIYNSLMASQKYKCAMCGNELKIGIRNAIAVDHDHSTNVIRGILCMSCNMSLGGFKDSIITLTNAIAYLALHSFKGRK